MPRVRVGALNLAPAVEPQQEWEPDRWSPRHDLAARLRGAGLRNNEIAAALGWSEAYVSVIVNDSRAAPSIQEAQQKVADGILDLNLRLRAHATEALDEIVEQMRNGTKEVVRQKAAFGILDRAGYTPPQRHTFAQERPHIPAELATLVREAHAEITETRRTIRFRAPAQEELALPPGEDLSGLVEGKASSNG